MATDSFSELMKYAGFDKFPRSLGLVHNGYIYQKLVYDYGEFYNGVWNVSNGTQGGRQSYTSHNSYPFADNRTLYSQQAFDVDTDKPSSTLQDSLEDMIKLVKFFDKIDKVEFFSGNGFHFLPRFHSQIIEIDVKLRYSVKEFQAGLVKKLGLKTVNLSCAEPRRILRIPGTLHSEDIKEKGIRHDIPVNLELMEQGIDAVLKASRARDLTYRENNDGKKKLDVQKMLKLAQGVAFLEDSASRSLDFSLDKKTDKELVDFVQWMLGYGLTHKLLQQHPGNAALVKACIFVYNFGLSLEEATYLFDRLSEIGQWYNRDNEEARHSAIKAIYEKRYILWQKN